jgi:hypothetical protein
MENVIQHLRDFLTNHLSEADKQELLGLIEDYRQGLVPLIVPLSSCHSTRHGIRVPLDCACKAEHQDPTHQSSRILT